MFEALKLNKYHFVKNFMLVFKNRIFSQYQRNELNNYRISVLKIIYIYV